MRKLKNTYKVLVGKLRRKISLGRTSIKTGDWIMSKRRKQSHDM